MLQASSIAVDVHVAPDLPTVFIDPDHVRQLLRNLVANARDAVAHRTRGKIRVEAARNAEGILIRVCDNGPGMHSADPEKIFDPFFTTKPGRLGLGLSIARAITTAYGGRLRAERSPQRWTEFSIELPIEPLTSATAFQAIPLTLTHGRSVLVIDDDEAIRGVMRRILTRAGYRVSQAWSGRSALSQIASGDLLDFVITDLRMADGTGPWFLNRLGEDFPQLLPRTVIVTGEGSTEEVERTARETGCRVVRKPFEFHQLIAALDEVASRG